jgi:elongation factor G
MEVEVSTPGQYLGEILGDLNSRRAQVQSMEGIGDTQVIRALVPLAEMFGYATSIRSLTQGRATYVMEFKQYQKVPENIAQKIMTAQGQK